MYRLFVLFILISISCTRFSNTEDLPQHQEWVADLDSLLMLGIDQTSKLHPDSARQTLTELLARAQKMDEPRYELLAYNNLGRLYQLIHLEDLATNSYLKAVDIAKTRNLTQYLNTLYNNLGIIYQQNKAYKQSLEYLTLALDQSRSQHDTTRIGLNLINLGVTLEQLGMDSNAVSSYREAVAYFTALNDSINLSPGYNGLGNYFYGQQAYDSALTYYQLALRFSPKLEYHWLHWVGELNVGKTRLVLGQPDRAAINLQNAILGFRQSNDLALLVEANRTMANVEKARGNFDDAIRYSDQAMAMQDSLLVKKSSKWASELQMNYVFGKKVKELDDLQSNAKMRQWLFGSGIAILLVIGLLLTYSFRNANKLLKQRNVILEKEQQLNALKLENRATEKRAMQMQLEYKNRELAGKAIHLISRDETFNRLRKELTEGLKKTGADQKTTIQQSLSIIKAEENMEEEWHSFIAHFEAVHPAFFQRLKSKNNKLTSNDLRICAYLTMDFSAKEIARIYNITPESVRKRKQRLREKLELESGVDLDTWLHQQRT